jgi:DnaJ-domain-containing protein 1
MNKRFALKMLDAIEGLQVENLALRAMLEKIAERRSGGIQQMEQMLEQLKADPRAQQEVRQRYAPVRRKLQDDSSLEEALQQFLQITPPPKDVN